MGKFVIRRTAAGYKFDLHAANGETVATSEVYSSYTACMKGIQSVEKCAASAGVADLTAGGAPGANPRFELYRDKVGAYRFRLRARNGKIISVSEGYRAKTGCLAGVESVRRNASGAAVEEQDIPSSSPKTGE